MLFYKMASTITRGQFFFFGCWNYDNCDPKEVPTGYADGKRRDYRKGVIEMIRRKLSKYAFGIIAGDNAYARYGKTYYKSTIDYGFDLLRGLQKKLYDAIGNHEIVATKVLDYEREKGQNLLAIAEDCTLHYATGFRVITLNTNLLSHKSHDKGTGSVPKTISMLKRVEEWLRTPFRGWTIVVGHEPIFSVKLKDKKIDVNILLGYERLLEILSLGERVVYMCADVHEFQAWNLIPEKGKIIPMIVAGTGGAIPDLPMPMQRLPYLFENKDNTLLGKMIVSQPAYGYCEVGTDRDGDLKIQYIPLQGCGYKPRPLTLQIQAGQGITVVQGNTKKFTPIPKACQAPIIDQALCHTKDVLYKPSS